MATCFQLQEEGGYIGHVRQCLVERQGLPAAPTNWNKADVVRTTRAVVNVWPCRVKLLNVLSAEETFSPPQHDALPEIRLVYLDGCQELHATKEKLHAEEARLILTKASGVLSRAKQAFLPSLQMSTKGPTSQEDQKIILLETITEPMNPQFVENALMSISWTECTSRVNVHPDGKASIDAFCVGLITRRDSIRIQQCYYIDDLCVKFNPCCKIQYTHTATPLA